MWAHRVVGRTNPSETRAAAAENLNIELGSVAVPVQPAGRSIPYVAPTSIPTEAQGRVLNAQSPDGATPLHVAASCGHVEIIKIIAGSGAEINLQDIRGFSPLHCSVEAGHFDASLELLRRGANPSLWDAKGQTAMDIAVKGKTMEHQRIAEMLENTKVLGSPAN